MSPAALLLKTLRARGVRLEPRGDRLRVEAPAGALTRSLRAHLLEHKPALLRLIRPDADPAAPRPSPRRLYAFPWPDALSGLGPRRVVPFDLCSGCAAGTWVVYGGTPRCLRCARAHAAGPEPADAFTARP